MARLSFDSPPHVPAGPTDERPAAGPIVGAARVAGLVDRMRAPDLRDRMMVITRGPASG
jgi:hypothetical protein